MRKRRARYLRASLEVLELLILAQAPKGSADAQIVGLGQLAGLLVYLLCKLACRRCYDANWASPLLQLRLVHDVHQQRQQKRSRLS